MSSSRQSSSSASSPSGKRNRKAAVSLSIPSQTLASRPSPGDHDGWCVHWSVQGQSWRTEPEIDQKRQAELAKYRAIVPNFERGIFPFKNVKLNRADVEWLLATHENGQGPVNWNVRVTRFYGGPEPSGEHINCS